VGWHLPRLSSHTLATWASALCLIVLASGPHWKLVPVAQGTAVWYEHTTTSIDAVIDPYARAFVALQGDWDRNPYPVRVKVGKRWANASRRDVTRSRYVAEFSPKLCDSLGLDYGWNRGVAFGKWTVTVYEVRRI
jgi:hypothetical protein